jgi:ABC-type nitrate/sulfonate/bicarbonate transport system substrate-binding protein
MLNVLKGVVLASLLLGPGVSAVSAQSKDLVPVTVAFTPTPDQVGLAIGINEGIFEKHGLDVQLTKPLPTGTEVVNAMQSKTAEFGQTGQPALGGMLAGMDLKLISLSGGDPTQVHADVNMSVIAREGSGIKVDDPQSLIGKRIGVAVGSLNQLYLFGVLERAGIDPSKVKMVNTPPAELAVALQTGGLDAAAIWEPWASVIPDTVAGSYQVMHAGGYVTNQTYIVVRGDFLREQPDIVEKFLLARVDAQQWMRQHPAETVETLEQWFPALKPEIIVKALNNVRTALDPRISGCTLLGLKEQVDFVLQTSKKAAPPGLNVEDFIDARFINKVEMEHPEFFSDLPTIPEVARMTADGKLQSGDVRAACGVK